MYQFHFQLNANKQRSFNLARQLVPCYYVNLQRGICDIMTLQYYLPRVNLARKMTRAQEALDLQDEDGRQKKQRWEEIMLFQDVQYNFLCDSWYLYACPNPAKHIG